MKAKTDGQPQQMEGGNTGHTEGVQIHTVFHTG